MVYQLADLVPCRPPVLPRAALMIAAPAARLPRYCRAPHLRDQLLFSVLAAAVCAFALLVARYVQV